MEAFLFEEALLTFIQSYSSPLTDAAMQGVTILGNPVFWIAISFGLLWWGRDKDAFFLMNLVVFSAAVVSIFKPLFAQARPSADKFRVIAIDAYGKFSFPSGHATVAGAAYAFVSKQVKELKKVLVVVALLVAFSRVYLGAHFLLDVIAGLAIGYLIGLCALWLKDEFEHAHFRITKIEEEAAALVVVMLALAAFSLFEPPTLSAVVFGWYVGFLVLKEQGLEVHELSKLENIEMVIIGFLSVLFLLGVSNFALSFSRELGIGFLFTLGIWAGYGYPAVFEHMRRHGIYKH